MKLVNKWTQEGPIPGSSPSAGILEHKSPKTGDKKESLLEFVFFSNPKYIVLNLPESHALGLAEARGGRRWGRVRRLCKTLQQLLTQLMFFHAMSAL